MQMRCREQPLCRRDLGGEGIGVDTVKRQIACDLGRPPLLTPRRHCRAYSAVILYASCTAVVGKQYAGSRVAGVPGSEGSSQPWNLFHSSRSAVTTGSRAARIEGESPAMRPFYGEEHNL